jgi:hypothetical protein
MNNIERDRTLVVCKKDFVESFYNEKFHKDGVYDADICYFGSGYHRYVMYDLPYGVWFFLHGKKIIEEEYYYDDYFIDFKSYERIKKLEKIMGIEMVKI